MSPELERVRQELVDLAGETRAADFERLVREDQDKISRESRKPRVGGHLETRHHKFPRGARQAGQTVRGAMTDELKQLAVQCRERLSETVDSNQEERVLLEAFREVQRQTVEAAAEIAEGGAPLSPINNRERGQRNTAKSIAERIRALLSPAQEVSREP